MAGRRSSSRRGAAREVPEPTAREVPELTAGRAAPRPAAAPLGDAVGSPLPTATRDAHCEYRPLDDPLRARALFDYTATPWPGGRPVAFALGAFPQGADPSSPPALRAAVVGEVQSGWGVLHGPVVGEAGGDVETDTAAAAHEVAELTAKSPALVDPLEVAQGLVELALLYARAAGAHTVLTRPQGLDRVWVRTGFIPVPESTIAPDVALPAGAGLYGWRDGSALWSLRAPAPAA